MCKLQSIATSLHFSPVPHPHHRCSGTRKQQHNVTLYLVNSYSIKGLLHVGDRCVISPFFDALSYAGESMSISRKHAVITYNFSDRQFELTVLGKNGVTLGSEQVTPDNPVRTLTSGACIRTSDSVLYFLLPADITPYVGGEEEAAGGGARASSTARGTSAMDEGMATGSYTTGTVRSRIGGV
jgi:hypothetical protein